MNRSSVSLPRLFLSRAAVVLLAALTALVGVASAASAHVTVSSQDASPGGFGKFTFRVPNESDTASTISVRVQIPEEAAMAFLSVQPVPGWTVTMTTTDLEEPIDAEGQEISSYVSVVEFRADAGGGIGPGEFQEFALSGGPFPDAESVAFPAVQTYSDGTESAWIEPTIDGQAEPEHPAPVLSLTADTAAGGGTTDEAASTDADDHSHEATSAPAGPALFLAILALLVAIVGAVLGWRATRRTVSS
jgi:periplasmic copper chaperone A